MAKSKKRAYDRLSLELAAVLQQQPNLLGQIETFSDPRLSQTSHRQVNAYSGDLFFGRVLYALPFFNSYHVVLSTGEVRVCVGNSGVGGGFLSVTPHTPISPDSAVLVFLAKNSFFGHIVSVLPTMVTSPKDGLSDWIVQGSRAGVRHASYYRDMIKKTADQGGILNYSGRKPNDILSTDYTWLTTLGNGLHIDPFYFFLRVDESCGIFGYTENQLLRIAAANLEEWSEQHTVERRNTESELSYYLGESVYPWETLGAYKPDITAYTNVSTKDVLYNKPLGALEPIDQAQQSFSRYEEYGGYLGQGRIRQVSIPPEGVDLNTLDSPPAFGVFREHIGLDGAYSLNTAKSFTFARRVRIAVPKRRKLDCDLSDSSDSKDTYKSSGKYGEGPDHVLKEVVHSDDKQHLSALAHTLDLQVHNDWKATSAFKYHEKDFELDGGEQKFVTVPDYSVLSQEQLLPTPELATKEIDHRYKDARILELLSFINADDFGNITIQAGSGAAIQLTVTGEVKISAPAGVSLESGKNIVLMAGDDAIVRAKNSIDITASEKDVRLKSEKNMQMLSNGGILLESRASGQTHEYPVEGGEAIQSSGVILKSDNSVVAAVSSEMYLRTTSGELVMDANAGRSTIRSRSSEFVRHVSSSVKDVFGLTTPTAVNQSSATTTRFGTGIDVNGPVIGSGYAEFTGQVSSVRGHMASASGGPVGKLKDPASRETMIRDRTSTSNSRAVEDSQAAYTSRIRQAYEAQGKLGNQETLRNMQFSFRSEEDYGTASNFFMLESPWQHMARETNQGLSTWQEKNVPYQNQPRMPWPGYKNWTSDTMLAPTSTLFDMTDGKEKDRQIMENPVLPVMQKLVPDKNYKVI